MEKKLNILQIIVQNKLRSGGAIQMFLLCRELVRRGHKVCAIYNGKGRIPEDFAVFEHSGIDLRFIDMNRLNLSKRSLDTIRALRKIIRDEKFDIIHAHKGNAVDLTWCATLGMHIPIVTNRGVNIPLNYFQSFKYRTRKVKRIVAVSQAVKDVMVKTGHIHPDKIQVVYGSIDITRFDPSIPSTLREELGIGSDKKVIGFVGNPNPRKGLRYLLEAFQDTVAPAFPESVLVIVGVSANDLHQYPVIPDHLRGRVHAIGFRRDIPNCMGAFDVFAFPGIHGEGLTGTVREAAAIRLPIVTTDVAGNCELIEDGVRGLVVPQKDSKKLGEALIRLLQNEDKSREYSANAREFVETHMTTEVRAETIESLYYRVLEENRYS
jgi:L-malate glycosyltransferase